MMRPSNTSRLSLVVLACLTILAAACTPITAPPTPPSVTPTDAATTQLANPASENCIAQGGDLTLATDGSGGQYGICVFEDNRQCEEWAMLEGACPVGGIKVTGYNSAAARYCAITGGTYQADDTAASDPQQEPGTCVLPDDQTCDVWDFYNGTCPPSTATSSTATSTTDPFAYCADVGTIDAPTGDFGTASNPGVPEAVATGLKLASGASADAPLELFTQNAYWRCMDGAVYACFVGANLPCDTKADTSDAPTQPMQDYCAQQPDAEFIPATVTGRATIYAWRCVDGAAQTGDQIFQVDAQGYLANIWYEIDPNAGE